MFTLFLCKLWKHGCDWDAPLNPDLCEQWNLYRRSIISFRIQYPRLVIPGTSQPFEIHGYFLSFIKADCACLYIRCYKNDNFYVELLCSKTRVAPLQLHDIHRQANRNSIISKIASKNNKNYSSATIRYIPMVLLSSYIGLNK